MHQHFVYICFTFKGIQWIVQKYQTLTQFCELLYILAFNSIEALEKNYLAQSPSHSLTDPALCREREGVLSRITVDKLVMKNRPSGPASSIKLPPPGETSVGFPWRPVPEHLVNLPGISESLTAGDPPLSQTRQLPHPLGQTSLRKHNGSISAPWPICSLKKRLRSWSRSLPCGACGICMQLCNDCVRPTNWRSPHASRLGRTHPMTCSQCCPCGSITQRVFPPPSDKRMMGHSTCPMLTSGCGWSSSPPLRVWW